MNLPKPALCLAVSSLLAAFPMRGSDALHFEKPQLDRPTPTVIGLKLPVTGQDDFTSVVTVRYREAGTQVWRDALPLLHVHPGDVTFLKVGDNFGGSIFDLKPATTYEIELHALDQKIGLDQTFLVTASTRALPSGPAHPHEVPVHDAQELRSALAAAHAGDIIELADGVYSGQFQISAAGTAADPIVIRGSSQDGTILDGNGCRDCNVLEIYGPGFVYVERLSIRNAQRAIRFQGKGAEGIVVRRVHTSDTIMGFSSQPNQKDFYICDNTLEGRLKWPAKYPDDKGAHSNDDGIQVQGFGHVICHNRITGFGDAMKTEQNGARAFDVYGNDVLYTYDNDIELDEGAGNVRCFRNRFLNSYAPISVQPIYGGPAYIFRNVVINPSWEQLKFHPESHNEPSGVWVLHNTFVSPNQALILDTSGMSHHFVLANNLFVGPNGPGYIRVVNWSGRMNDAIFDYNGYYPAGGFHFDFERPRRWEFSSFADLQASGVEKHGIILSEPPFASGLAAPLKPKFFDPADVAPASHSGAIDRGIFLPNISDHFTGSAPDLGAVEVGCPTPIYGPRPEGIDESNEPLGCGSRPGETPPPSIDAAVRVLSLREGVAGSEVKPLNARSPRELAEDALLLSAVGSPLEAAGYFTKTNFLSEKPEPSVREAYIEIQLQALLAKAAAHNCANWEQAMSAAQGDDPNGLFTVSFSAFTRRLRFQYLLGAAELDCGDTRSAQKRWEKVARGNADPGSTDYPYPAMALLRVDPAQGKAKAEGALQTVTKALRDAPPATRPVLLYSQGLLHLVLGDRDHAATILEAAASQSTGIMRYLCLDVLRSIRTMP